MKILTSKGLSLMAVVFLLSSLLACAQDAATPQENKAAAEAAGAIATFFTAAFGLFFLSFWVIWLVFMIVAILGLILWVIMLIDCVKREFKDQNEKIVWILILALTNWIGAVIYYFLVKRKADAEGRSAPTQDKPKAKKQEST